jgi:hypothetical protein
MKGRSIKRLSTVLRPNALTTMFNLSPINVRGGKAEAVESHLLVSQWRKLRQPEGTCRDLTKSKWQCLPNTT